MYKIVIFYSRLHIFICKTLVFASIAETVRDALPGLNLGSRVHPAWSFLNPRQLFFWATNQISLFSVVQIQISSSVCQSRFYYSGLICFSCAIYAERKRKSFSKNSEEKEYWFRTWAFKILGYQMGLYDVINYFNYTPTNSSIDVVVIEQPDGTLKVKVTHVYLGGIF